MASDPDAITIAAKAVPKVMPPYARYEDVADAIATAVLSALSGAGYRLVREEDINRARGHAEQIRAFAADCEGMAWATIAVSAAEIVALLGGNDG